MSALLHKRRTLDFHLFQAHMWIDYVRAWDGKPTSRKTTYTILWLETVFMVPRKECVRLAKAHLYLARRINRKKYKADNSN